MFHRKATARRLFALASLALAALFGMTAPAFADDDLPGRVGRVADVAGELFLAPQEQPEQWTGISIDSPVTTGDNLWVGSEGRAEIDFGAGQFRLAGDTNLHVSRLDDRQFALFVAQGRVSVRVRVLDPGETASIDTPNAQLVLTRPGLYRIDVSDDRQHTRLVVREGEANVLTQAAAQQVLPGQTAVIDGADARYASVSNGIGTGRLRHVGGEPRRPVPAWNVCELRVAADGRRRRPRPVRHVVAGARIRRRSGIRPPSEPDWAPYRNGYWADVGAWGPTWVDAAPWGYAPFHYGRWAYIGNRWGWCPGYLHRAPAGGARIGRLDRRPGLGNFGRRLGGPVFGWVPLAWGEPYRPWWNRCSYGCWDRYNRPYAVNVTSRASGRSAADALPERECSRRPFRGVGQCAGHASTRPREPRGRAEQRGDQRPGARGCAARAFRARTDPDAARGATARPRQPRRSIRRCRGRPGIQPGHAGSGGRRAAR